MDSYEIIYEFLELYEQEPILWNPKHILHKNRNEVRDCWLRIQSKFSIKCTIDELKKKKESLMATFRPLLKKVKQSMKSGAGSEDIFKPTWFAYDRMAKFLTPAFEVRTTINTQELDDAPESEVLEEETEQDEVSLVNDVAVESSVESLAENYGSSNEEISSGSPFQSPLSRGTKKRKLFEINQIENQMADAYKIMKKVYEKPKKEKDSCDLYSELLASKLREFSEFQRAIVMNEIDNLVFRAKMQEIQKQTNTSPINSQSFVQASSQFMTTLEYPSTSFECSPATLQHPRTQTQDSQPPIYQTEINSQKTEDFTRTTVLSKDGKSMTYFVNQ